jgi:hypothetical protein
MFVVSTLLYNTRFSYFIYQYHFNNKVFTENYCINKDKPELKCNGKCELAKLAKAAEKQEQNNKNISDIEILFFIHVTTLFEIKKNSVIILPIQTSCNKHNYECLIYFDPPPKINFQALS